MTYRAEAFISIDTSFPTLRMSTFTPSNNDELLGKSLDLIEERREKRKGNDTTILLPLETQERYDVNVKLQPLTPGTWC